MAEEVREFRQQRFTRPPGATQILLVRHGQSRAARPDEPFPLVDGHGDPELSELGRKQAILVGERLREEAIDAIYVTNLRRTRETADPLLQHLGVEPIVEPDLREVHLGEWEGGLLRQKAHEQDPIFIRMQQEERWDVIPGAEPYDVLKSRVHGALGRIAERHRDETVAAFVHGGIVGHILAHACGARPFAFNGADNGSISQVVIWQDRMIVRGFNDVAHLVDALSDAAMT